MVRRKDLGSLDRSADALTAQASQRQAATVGHGRELEKLTKIDELEQAAKAAERQRDMDGLAQLLGANPKAAVRVGGLSVNPHDPLEGILRGRALDDKDTDNERLEAKAIQDEFHRTGGGDMRKRAEALLQARQLLNSKDRMTFGQFRTALARMRQGGQLTDRDIELTSPSTLAGSAKNALGYLLGGTKFDPNVAPLDDGQIKRYGDYFDTELAAVNDQIARGQGELNERAPMLAPTLHKKGKLPKVVQSLGNAQRSQQSGGLSAQEQAELEQLRKELGN